MHLGLALVTYLQTPKAVQPTVRALYHPAVAAQLFAAVHAPTGNAVLDAAPLQGIAQSLAIVAFVRMNFDGPTLEGDRVNGFDEHFAIGSVGRRAEDRQRQAVSVYHKMALRALFATIRIAVRLLRIGFGPVDSPLLGRRPVPSPPRRVPNRHGPPHRVWSAKSRAGSATHLRLASL